MFCTCNCLIIIWFTFHFSILHIISTIISVRLSLLCMMLLVSCPDEWSNIVVVVIPFYTITRMIFISTCVYINILFHGCDLVERDKVVRRYELFNPLFCQSSKKQFCRESSVVNCCIGPSLNRMEKL